MTSGIDPVPFVDLKRQYASIRSDIETSVQKILASGAYSTGHSVAAFEELFAGYCGVRHCIAVNSGTSALHLAIIASGVQSGDEVITVPFTFVATAWAISYAGAKPVFVDVDPDTCTMDIEKIARAIGPKTRAILPVHLFGQMANLEPIRKLCKNHGLTLIEDAAQAHGAKYQGQRAGGYGDIGCFSFYPTKNLGAFGEAGAVTTNDAKVAERIRHLRDHAQVEKYRHEELGYNYRMDEIQGATLAVKLRHLDDWNTSRSKLARNYIDRLGDLPITLPSETSDRLHVWHLFVIRSPRREHLRRNLARAGVSTGLHYPIPLHLQPAYSRLGYRSGDFPVAEQLANECLSLPMFPELQEAELDRVCESIASAISRH